MRRAKACLATEGGPQLHPKESISVERPFELCSKRGVVAVLASGVVISLTALTGGIAPAFAQPGDDSGVTTTVVAPAPEVTAPPPALRRRPPPGARRRAAPHSRRARPRPRPPPPRAAVGAALASSPPVVCP